MKPDLATKIKSTRLKRKMVRYIQSTVLDLLQLYKLAPSSKHSKR